MDSKKIGYRITAALAAENKKQLDLAKHLNIQPNTISYFCSGTRTPNTLQIIEIAKFLNVSSDYLLGLSDAPTQNTELKAVCEYTGLSQKALEKVLDCFQYKKGILSQIIECDEFWYLVNIMHDSLLNKDYLEPSGDRIIESIKAKVNNKNVDFMYRKALQLIGLYGLEPIFKQELTEIVIDMFDNIVKGEKDE